MKICDKTNEVKANPAVTKYVCGNLYSSHFCKVAVYNQWLDAMISLEKARSTWVKPDGNWVDVTDQYCLTKVK